MMHNRTDRGVLAPILMHAMVNVSAALTPAYDEPVIPICLGLLMLVPAVVMTVADAKSVCAGSRPARRKLG
ncbi:hypothetical protein ACQPW1_14990 [Nocardia sp. CA-128927]|uniref:hypothetical protein n=1 Tax=Nocardia sp. CA-128927 TaxID=3239975 RepID=UPI003D990948